MAHGADRAQPVARADLARATGCEVCRGSVISDEWLHELCPVCQTGERPTQSVTNPPGTPAGSRCGHATHPCGRRFHQERRGPCVMCVKTGIRWALRQDH
ncbi:hypothetical protein GCM10027072_76200 [Streptomyces bullii]